MAAALPLFVAAPARAGTYDVVACHVDGAQATNLAWTREPYNSAGKAAPALANFVVNGSDPVKCAPAVGAQFSTAGAKRSVKVDDGAAWTFRAPAGTIVRRVQIWRHGTARASTDDPNTAHVENGWWNVVARAGDGPGGRVVLSGEICSGALPAPTYCATGGAFAAGSSVTLDIGEPVVAWGVQCAGTAITSWCFTGDGTTFHARFDLQAARVTVEDLVAPELAPDLPAGGARRPGDPIAASATDSAGIRSLRVLVDGVERFTDRQDCDYRRPAPCSTSAAHTYDLSGVADGLHTITTVAEDAATNLTRLDRTVVVDSTPPVIDRVPVKGRTISASVADATSGVA
ncbi:MAG TPA: hypothetical protein VFG79_00575, partial [Solirubrobacter sp.]|nr:hypothetical protein [Solirubrobacter sp.]